MARQPRGSTEVDAVSENEIRPGNDSDNADSTNNDIESEDLDRPDTDVDNDDDEDELAPTVDPGVDALAGSTPASRDIYITNARDGLNLRSGPSTEFPIVRSLPFGTRVHLIKREGRWGLIDEQGDGATDGFVHLAFLDESASVDIQTGAMLPEDQVRAFWANRNPRGAQLYNGSGKALVDPRLLHASAAGTAKLEGQSPNYRIEIYGPSSGFRSSGSTANHGAQASTGRGAATDFVIIDLRTGKMLTNHPAQVHQHQGTVGDNAPLYQSFYNEVVRAGSQLYPRFEEMARFGGYFASGGNAMDTMHIDMRGLVAPMAGGSLRGGFTRAQMTRWHIPENRPYA